MAFGILRYSSPADTPMARAADFYEKRLSPFFVNERLPRVPIKISFPGKRDFFASSAIREIDDHRCVVVHHGDHVRSQWDRRWRYEASSIGWPLSDLPADNASICPKLVNDRANQPLGQSDPNNFDNSRIRRDVYNRDVCNLPGLAWSDIKLHCRVFMKRKKLEASISLIGCRSRINRSEN